MKRLAQVEQVSKYMLPPMTPASTGVVSALDLAALDLAVSDMSAAIVHEVNQPLAVILTSAETALRWLAADPPNLGMAQQAMERVVRNSRRAADVARSVRELVRKSSLAAISLDINGVIDDALALASLDVLRHDVVVEVCLADGLGPIEGDRMQLERLVANLIGNSIEAMSVVEDRQRKLRISSEADKLGAVRVSVEDTGTGIEPARIEHIFDPFFTTKPEGLGLGLSICRSIVGAHGGRLWAAPNLPHGSVFSFLLPARSR